MAKFKFSKSNLKTPLAKAIERKKPQACQWFLLCDNPATTTLPHPILGEVPCCDRCAAKVKGLQSPRP